MRIINLARAHASLPSTASTLSILYLAAVFFSPGLFDLLPLPSLRTYSSAALYRRVYVGSGFKDPSNLCISD